MYDLLRYAYKNDILDDKEMNAQVVEEFIRLRNAKGVNLKNIKYGIVKFNGLDGE